MGTKEEHEGPGPQGVALSLRADSRQHPLLLSGPRAGPASLTPPPVLPQSGRRRGPEPVMRTA